MASSSMRSVLPLSSFSLKSFSEANELVHSGQEAAVANFRLQNSVSIAVSPASEVMVISLICPCTRPLRSRCRVEKTREHEKENAGRGAYATTADFKRIFSEDVNSLYLLSLLLTGTPDKAEKCFVEGIGESAKGNYIFKEWARSWARRTIIQSAIRLIAPLDYSLAVSGAVDVARGMEKIPIILHAEVRAVLELAPLERFVFVMSVLERYSDNDCSTLLGCARRDIAPLRTRALQQLGMFLRSKYQIEPSSENPTAPENIAMITTPLIAQYFAAPEWPTGVSLG